RLELVGDLPGDRASGLGNQRGAATGGREVEFVGEVLAGQPELPVPLRAVADVQREREGLRQEDVLNRGGVVSGDVVRAGGDVPATVAEDVVAEEAEDPRWAHHARERGVPGDLIPAAAELDRVEPDRLCRRRRGARVER